MNRIFIRKIYILRGIRQGFLEIKREIQRKFHTRNCFVLPSPLKVLETHSHIFQSFSNSVGFFEELLPRPHASFALFTSNSMYGEQYDKELSQVLS